MGRVAISATGAPRTPAARPPSLAGVLKIAREHVDKMIAHARRDHPDEACGVIVGPEGSDEPVRLVEMINADRSPTFFRFDPTEVEKERDVIIEELLKRR